MPENTGLIGAARERIAEIEAEIGSVRAEIQAHVRERAPLLNSTEPDAIQHAEALTKAIQRLERELPIAGAEPGAWRPELQQRLELAQAELKRLRDLRYELARELDMMIELREHIGERLPELRAAIHTAHDIMRAMRWPTATLVGQASDHTTHVGRLRAWVDDQHARIERVPTWERRIAELGDDPDYRPEPRRWYDDDDQTAGPREFARMG